MKQSIRILFLCTGNSCRSQMAEGFARDWVEKSPFVPIEVLSAGIESHGINPVATAVMAELGVDISRQQSTTLTSDVLADLDQVVTLCSHAEDHCPALPRDVEKSHWPLDDPAQATGTPAVGVLLYDPDTDMVALIEQFRIGALNEPEGPWQLELLRESQKNPSQLKRWRSVNVRKKRAVSHTNFYR